MADVTEDLRIPSLAQVKELIALLKAVDVDALPLDGSVDMTGNLKINKASYPSFVLYSGDSDNRLLIQRSGTSCVFSNQTSDGKSALVVYPNSNVLENRIQLVVDDSAWYDLFGAHNKPTGRYTGNGSATKREIAVGGIGKFLKIVTSYGSTITVSYNGAYAINPTTGEMKYFPREKLYFDNGVLYIATDDVFVNASGAVYEYEHE